MVVVGLFLCVGVALLIVRTHMTPTVLHVRDEQRMEEGECVWGGRVVSV